jgi:hypothetical protein
MPASVRAQNDTPGEREITRLSRSRLDRCFPHQPSLKLTSASLSFNYASTDPSYPGLYFLVLSRRRFRHVLAIYPWHRRRIPDG